VSGQRIVNLSHFEKSSLHHILSSAGIDTTPRKRKSTQLLSTHGLALRRQAHPPDSEPANTEGARIRSCDCRIARDPVYNGADAGWRLALDHPPAPKCPAQVTFPDRQKISLICPI
jgi:hypothetical protein